MLVLCSGRCSPDDNMYQDQKHHTVERFTYILSELRVNKRLLLAGSGEKCVYSDLRLADVLLSNEGDKERWSKGIQDFLVGELGVKPGRCTMSITPIPLNVGSIEGRPVSEWVPPPDWYGGY
ncbi:uncharacterized protein LOC144915639 isoform X2 [Branchiostoma floridae x Branchiostoma belcheri]